LRLFCSGAPHQIELVASRKDQYGEVLVLEYSFPLYVLPPNLPDLLTPSCSTGTYISTARVQVPHRHEDCFPLPQSLGPLFHLSFLLIYRTVLVQSIPAEKWRGCGCLNTKTELTQARSLVSHERIHGSPPSFIHVLVPAACSIPDRGTGKKREKKVLQ